MGSGVKDVARVAGVSPATVSRVLAGKKVDPDLAARVRSAVISLDYRPNLSARRLRSRHSNTVGLIVADIRNPFFTAVTRAIEDVAYQHGMRVILCNTDENPERERLYLRYMQEEGATGVILAPTRQTASSGKHDFPLVLIDRAPPGLRHDCVVLDNEQAAADLVNHLYRQGFSRITGIFGADSTTGKKRHEGYVRAMESLGLKPDAVFASHGKDAEAIRALLSAPERPEALLVSNGLMLMTAVRETQALELKIPQDIALAGFDNDTWTEFVVGGLTLIEQPVEAIGQTAMTMLLERLKSPEAPVRKVTLSGRCLIRNSTTGIVRPVNC